MKIGRNSSWYRPYYVVASGKEYKVNKIYFYDKEQKIVTSSNSSWLETEKGEDIESIELPIEEMKTKRKPKLDGTSFAISKGIEKYGTEYIADVYIPCEMFDIHFDGHEIKFNQLRRVYRGINGIYISEYVRDLEEEAYAIKHAYAETLEEVDKYKLNGYMTDNDKKEFLKNIDKLKELAEEYIKEIEAVKNLTLDDVI